MTTRAIRRCSACGVLGHDRRTCERVIGPRSADVLAAQRHEYERKRKRRAKDPDGYKKRQRDTMRRWRSDGKNRERQRELDRARYADNPEWFRESKIRKCYGLTLDEYEALKAAHAGKCAICGKEADLDVDHDHKSGKVRGLLCTKCNIRVGWIETEKGWRMPYLDYIRKHHTELRYGVTFTCG